MIATEPSSHLSPAQGQSFGPWLSHTCSTLSQPQDTRLADRALWGPCLGPRRWYRSFKERRGNISKPCPTCWPLLSTAGTAEFRIRHWLNGPTTPLGLSLFLNGRTILPTPCHPPSPNHHLASHLQPPPSRLDGIPVFQSKNS